MGKKDPARFRSAEQDPADSTSVNIYQTHAGSCRILLEQSKKCTTVGWKVGKGNDAIIIVIALTIDMIGVN